MNRNMERERIVRAMSRTRMVFYDGDDTLWKGMIAEGIGKGFMIEALRRGDLGVVGAGILGSLEVKGMLRNGKDADALRRFYDILIENGLGDEVDIRRLARTYIRTHELGEVSGLRREVDLPSILITKGGSTGADVAAGYFKMERYVANEDMFDARMRINGVNLKVRNGRDKLMLAIEIAGSLDEIKRSTVIGNDDADILLMSEAGFSVASPYATKEVKDLAKACVELRR